MNTAIYACHGLAMAAMIGGIWLIGRDQRASGSYTAGSVLILAAGSLIGLGWVLMTIKLMML